MKKVSAYSIVDRLSDSIISTFYSPNVRMAVRSFDNFCKDFEKKSGDSAFREDLLLYCSPDDIAIPETTSEVEDMKLYCVCSGSADFAYMYSTEKVEKEENK